MASRPTNHASPPNKVVAELIARRSMALPEGQLPVLDQFHLMALEAVFKPRCYDPAVETLEMHLVYSGKVELIARLRQEYETNREEPQEDKEED